MASVGLAAVLGRTYEHADRGSVRMLLTQANWTEGCDILVDMDAAYALLPSDLAVLFSRSAQNFTGRDSASPDSRILNDPAPERVLPDEEYCPDAGVP